LNFDHTYIDGTWRDAEGVGATHIVDSYTEAVFGTVRTSSPAQVDIAARAARRALPAWSATPVAERAAALRAVADELEQRAGALAEAIMREVGMPRKLVQRIQVGAPISAWRLCADLAETLDWESRIGHSLVRQVPVGVVGCITPWNYPLHQITAKVAPALAAGCTVVLKPSEIAPLSAFLLAQAIEAAGVPPGVFNLVHGTGQEIGDALVRHPEVDMVSFTGSTRAGRQIGAIAGAQIKRVSLELGGKSAALVLPGADLAAAVKATLASCFLNAGQTCSALTRLLVPRADYDRCVLLILDLMRNYVMGDPADPATRLGPLVSSGHRDTVLAMLAQAGLDGVGVVAGGAAGYPVPATGFFVPPTVLGPVTSLMTVAQQEVFGPVLALMPYDDVDEAVRIANGTPYGLAGAVWGATPDAAYCVARRLRAGQIDINGAPFNLAAPFGGFGQSGMGRENGRFGIQGFLEPISYQFNETT
jgi:acyl-CoA reductase-like NAD-dependent aldehyde dehydrogenase